MDTTNTTMPAPPVTYESIARRCAINLLVTFQRDTLIGVAVEVYSFDPVRIGDATVEAIAAEIVEDACGSEGAAGLESLLANLGIAL